MAEGITWKDGRVHLTRSWPSVSASVGVTGLCCRFLVLAGSSLTALTDSKRKPLRLLDTTARDA